MLGDVDYFSYVPASDPFCPLSNDSDEEDEDYCDKMMETDDYDDLPPNAPVLFDCSDHVYSDETTETNWHEDVASGRPIAYYSSTRCHQRSGLQDGCRVPLPFLCCSSSYTWL